MNTTTCCYRETQKNIQHCVKSNFSVKQLNVSTRLASVTKPCNRNKSVLPWYSSSLHQDAPVGFWAVPRPWVLDHLSVLLQSTDSSETG